MICALVKIIDIRAPSASAIKDETKGSKQRCFSCIALPNNNINAFSEFNFYITKTTVILYMNLGDIHDISHWS